MLFLSTKNYLQAEHAFVENDRFLVFILPTLAASFSFSYCLKGRS